MSKKIFIDAGHGGNEPGAVNGGRLEKNDTLNFSLALGKRLQDHGFEVKQSRTADVSVTLNERTKAANAWKADLLISVHRNSFSKATANGMETWVYTNVNQTTKNFANHIHNEIIGVYAQSNRGVKQGNLHMCRESAMPAVLLELGFISNALDNQKHDEFFNQYVEAVVKGVCKGFGVNYSGLQSTSQPQQNLGKLYKVQIGSFSNKANAENMLQKAKTAGFVDAYVVKS